MTVSTSAFAQCVIRISQGCAGRAIRDLDSASRATRRREIYGPERPPQGPSPRPSPPEGERETKRAAVRPLRLAGGDEDPAQREPSDEDEDRRGERHPQPEPRLEHPEQERHAEPADGDERPERRREAAAEEQPGRRLAVRAARREAREEERQHHDLEPHRGAIPAAHEVTLPVREREEEEERRAGGDAGDEEERSEQRRAPQRPRAERREQDARVHTERDPGPDAREAERRRVGDAPGARGAREPPQPEAPAERDGALRLPLVEPAEGGRAHV